MEALAPDDAHEIAGYPLRARLGEGGMGMVYLSHTRGGQPVALKVVRREYAQDPEFRRRFTQEVTAARRVQGPYTAPVLDSFTEGPEPWLAVSYVPGPSLSSAVYQHGPLPLRTVLQLTAGIAEALGTIHAAGVIHRDLKPSNVLLASDGPRVIDFGIARAADTTALTGTDVRLGTPGYMAPEQAMGGEVTPALDVFALGLVAHFAATRSHPYGEGSSHALLYRIVSADPDLTTCPAELHGIIAACLAKNPADRPTPAQIIEACHALAGAEGLVRHEGWWLPPAVAQQIAQQEQTLRLHLSSAAPATPVAAPTPQPPQAAYQNQMPGTPQASPIPTQPAHSPATAFAAAAPTQPAHSPEGSFAAAPTAPTYQPLSGHSSAQPSYQPPYQSPNQPPLAPASAPTVASAQSAPAAGRRRTGLIAAIAVVGVLAVGGGSVAAYQLMADNAGNTTASGKSGSDSKAADDTSGNAADADASPSADEDAPKTEPGWQVSAQNKVLVLRAPKYYPNAKDVGSGTLCDPSDVTTLDINKLTVELNDGYVPSSGQWLTYTDCPDPIAYNGIRLADESGAIGITTERRPTPSECRATAREASVPNPIPLSKIRNDSLLKTGTGLCIESSDGPVIHLRITKVNKDQNDNLRTYVFEATQWKPE
ncbi:serine/threonine-protein kinase [Streptomyces sp. NPDC002896]|uniref:serine/threonine protein kinase n=1 Tax=Streptomyces sp. NPDC002896 TaxID=3154438 RepID=UPI003326B168